MQLLGVETWVVFRDGSGRFFQIWKGNLSIIMRGPEMI